jgi:hypothetical protein
MRSGHLRRNSLRNAIVRNNNTNDRTNNHLHGAIRLLDTLGTPSALAIHRLHSRSQEDTHNAD